MNKSDLQKCRYDFSGAKSGRALGQLKGLYLGLLVTLIGLFLSWAPFGFDLEDRYGLSWLFWSRGAQRPPPEVLIVAFDSRSAKRIGWPEKPDRWPRTLHADLTAKLSKACARVIIYDLFFRTSRPSGEDEVFANAIRAAGNVVLVAHLGIAEDEALSQAHQANIQTTYLPVRVLEEAAAAVAPFPLPNAPEGVTGFWAFKTSAGGQPDTTYGGVSDLCTKRIRGVYSSFKEGQSAASCRTPYKQEPDNRV